MLDDFDQQIRESIRIKTTLLEDSSSLELIAQVCELLCQRIRMGNKIIFAGNGGSAADAQHLAAELVSRYEFDRPGLPAMSLSTDTSILTAIGNDYGYEHLFSRQLHAIARSGDVFVGVTTSGKSRNICRAFEACKELKLNSVALCGQGGELDRLVHYCIRVPSDQTPRIQECHILIGHLICSQVERLMFPSQANSINRNLPQIS